MTDLSPTFSDPAVATCPECGGPLLLGHPGGMVYRHHTLAGCSLQDAEDTRQFADKEGLGFPPYVPGADNPPGRPITPTERTLLAAAGITYPDDADAVCRVGWLTDGVCFRAFLVDGVEVAVPPVAS